jgi:hypothetical protein
MTKDEALDLALEALGLYQAAGFGNSTDFNKQHEAFYKAQTAIIAIKQACALDKKAENARELGLDYEPAQQKPVASVPIHPKTGPLWAMTTDKPDPERLPSYPLMRLYTAPPAAQRPWIGLSDEEYVHITDTVFHQGHGLVAYYLAIEAKLKEKNT